MRNKYSDFWYYKFNSFYYDKITKAKESFSEVLVLTQEELNKETQQTLIKVYSFLDVNTKFTPSNINKKYNKGGLYKKNILTNFIFRQGKIKNIFKKVIKITPWMKNIKNKIISNYQYKPKPITIETENKLISIFRDDVLKITKMGVDTSTWNEKFFEK